MNSFDALAQKAKLDALRGRFNQQTKNQSNQSEKALFKARLNQPQILRIVPIPDGDIPIQELKFYYNTGVTEKVGSREYKISVLSPSSYGESDPLEMFEEMLTSENSEEYKNLNLDIKSKILYQLKCSSKFFLPVIVRGQEASGVKYWGVTEKLLQSLLDNIEKDGHLIYDPINGRDIKVWIEDMGTYKQTKFELGKLSSLGSEDVVKQYMTNQPELISQFTKKSFNELKEIIGKVLEPYTDTTSQPEPSEETGMDYTSVHKAAPTEQTQPPVAAADPVAAEPVKTEEDPFGDLPF
tara:strand:+ start:2448 stop:3335 length:888 start_codon:yes stop_codon:yes gene_type:complete